MTATDAKTAPVPSADENHLEWIIYECDKEDTLFVLKMESESQSQILTFKPGAGRFKVILAKEGNFHDAVCNI